MTGAKNASPPSRLHFGAALWLCAILLALLSAMAMPALAADAKGRFSIRGAGTVSCAVFLKATPAQRVHAETWWAGYLTAMNRTTPGTYDVLGKVTPAQANQWLRNYCRKYPRRRYSIAVHDLLRAAYAKRTRTSPNTRPTGQPANPRRGRSEPDPFDGLLDKPNQ
jgi:hypothetical protein